MQPDLFWMLLLWGATGHPDCLGGMKTFMLEAWDTDWFRILKWLLIFWGEKKENLNRLQPSGKIHIEDRTWGICKLVSESFAPEPSFPSYRQYQNRKPLSLLPVSFCLRWFFLKRSNPILMLLTRLLFSFKTKRLDFVFLRETKSGAVLDKIWTAP